MISDPKLPKTLRDLTELCGHREGAIPLDVRTSPTCSQGQRCGNPLDPDIPGHEHFLVPSLSQDCGAEVQIVVFIQYNKSNIKIRNCMIAYYEVQRQAKLIYGKRNNRVCL